MNNQSIPDVIDTLIIAGKNDIKLLRHFFESQKLFSKLGGETHLFIWQSEQYLLDQINVPQSTIVHYKDDIPEMVVDDFRNQMYIKLIADRFIKNEWVWIADADYLICDYICPQDFFTADGSAYWFYRTWDGGPPEQRWRAGCEKFMNGNVPFLFLDEAQFLINTKVLFDFRENYDPRGMLYQSPMPSEFLVYGAYAFEKFNRLYEWIDLMRVDANTAISYKINQQPPNYCVLDPDVALAKVPPAKYYVFWSYWELAELKMKEFLSAAALIHAPGVSMRLAENKINIRICAESLLSGSQDGIQGIHLDGWVHRNLRLLFANEKFRRLRIFLESPGRPGNKPMTGLRIALNGVKLNDLLLNPGENSIDIDIVQNEDNLIDMIFRDGVAENNGNRELFARVTSFVLVNN